MTKRRPTATFIFLLLAAFMVFKWSPSHAHLNVQHDHGGEQHQHSVEAHAHQPDIFHADTIDSNHPQMDEGRVVDLDHVQCTQNDKTQDNPELSTFSYCPPLTQTGEIGLSHSRNPLHFLLHHQPRQPRAPPLLT